MSVFQRQLLITVVLAGLAGFAGVWFGAHGFDSDTQVRAPLRMAVDELTKRGLVGLTQTQKQQINEIESRYAHKRSKLRGRIAWANSELADALVEEMSLGPKVETSIEHLKSVVGELQHETVAYVLELRATLTEPQRTIFDEKVVSALMTPPG
jgi:nickel and cobalt resistance protein CnrR